MSPASLFEESSEWDPKHVRKRLIVSQDQLIKLNSIPGKHYYDDYIPVYF